MGQGALTTILLALVAVLVCWAIGMLAGTVPALSAGPFEAANAVPPVLAGMVVAALMGPSAQGAVIAVLAVSWAPLAAHAASLVEEANATAYSRMAPLLGVSRPRLVLTKLLPGVAGPVFRHAMLRLPGTALALAALGFLGLGPQPPTPDWGLLLNEGIDYIERAPWVAAAPMLALIALSVLAVSLSSRRA
ncbi:ABC transporter permease subunit [Rothia sp. AR01]|uniref:ABC transporter permease subunit n=1 Tax=Rothia santali TaxID=2949643 RepID=A0A9X2HC70_9MICC|nr:ABC transporter permease subunit [Rothia santali]MCP3426666.1 ABC transporter permease subunit [Rothia santali]